MQIKPNKSPPKPARKDPPYKNRIPPAHEVNLCLELAHSHVLWSVLLLNKSAFSLSAINSVCPVQFFVRDHQEPGNLCPPVTGRSVRLWFMPKSNPACNWPWATCSELSVIHSMCFSLQALFVCRKNQAAPQGRLLPALGLGDGQLQSQSSQRSPLPAGLQSESLPAVLLSSRA